MLGREDQKQRDDLFRVPPSPTLPACGFIARNIRSGMDENGYSGQGVRLLLTTTGSHRVL